MAGNIEECEAKQHCAFTAILDGQKSPGLVLHEVGNRHFAAGNECRKTCEQTQDDQNTPGKFNDAGGQEKRIMVLRVSAERAKELLRPVAQEEKSDHDAKGRISCRFQSAEK